LTIGFLYTLDCTKIVDYKYYKEITSDI